jgi:hypothetical protein
MERLRSASFEEYVRWYLERERRKRGQEPAPGRSWSAMLHEMRASHGAKLRPWFERARWSLVALGMQAEAMSLVCVDSQETRRNQLVSGTALNNRLARTVVVAAHENGYFDNLGVRSTNAVEGHYRQERIEVYRRNWPQLRDRERLTLCTLNAGEQAENPEGSYYLHDGFGRLLPLLYLVVYESRAYTPIEAFLAEDTSQ